MHHIVILGVTLKLRHVLSGEKQITDSAPGEQISQGMNTGGRNHSQGPPRYIYFSPPTYVKGSEGSKPESVGKGRSNRRVSCRGDLHWVPHSSNSSLPG